LDSPVVDRAVDAVCTQRGARADEILVVGRDGHRRLAGRGGARLLITDGPRLPGAARNEGVAASRGDLIVFLDADCVPEPDWLQAHVSRHQSGEAVVGGAVLWDDGPYWQLADNLSMFHEFSRWSTAGYRPYLPTLNLSVARRVFAAVGPMDPGLPRGEDLDWTIRAGRLGFRPYFEPQARLWHRPARSSPQAVWSHWHESGRWLVGVRRRHPDAFGAPTWLYGRGALLGLSVFMAARATARLYVPGRPGARYPRTAPAVFLTKLAWCLGAARPAPLTAGALAGEVA
jgi:GT2 family glycosyltransferase